jgi:uncharacterized protein YraI
LIGRNANASWARVRLFNGAEGWASTLYLYAELDFMSLPLVPIGGAFPTPTPLVPPSTVFPPPAPTVFPPTPSALPPVVMPPEPAPVEGTAVVDAGRLNVRAGPGIAFAVITSIPEGEFVTLIGRNPGSTWYKVRLGNGVEGWVNAFYISIIVPPADLPILTE